MLSLARHLPTLHLICIGAASASGDLFSAPHQRRNILRIPWTHWTTMAMGWARSCPEPTTGSVSLTPKAKPQHVVVPGGETMRPGESPIASEGSLEPDGNGRLRRSGGDDE